MYVLVPCSLHLNRYHHDIPHLWVGLGTNMKHLTSLRMDSHLPPLETDASGACLQGLDPFLDDLQDAQTVKKSMM